MRLWQLLLAVMMAATVFAVAREPAGRVALVVFCTGVGELVLGTTAIMALFQTLGAFGSARRVLAHVEALAATVVVLLVASASMNALLWVGVFLARRVVP